MLAYAAWQDLCPSSEQTDVAVATAVRSRSFNSKIVNTSKHDFFAHELDTECLVSR
jgi:hypothetical protein